MAGRSPYNGGEVINMDQVKTGELIKALRQQEGMTQRALAELLGVSDKAVSKWERGCGAPELTLLPRLAEALRTDVDTLLKGGVEPNRAANGNLRRLRCYRCPTCGNLLFSTDGADIRCCGRPLKPLTAQKADDAHALHIEQNDGDWYITAEHEMTREHYISFVALLTGDTVVLRKLYPEWGLETRLPRLHETLLWYCTGDGLFQKGV